VEIVAPHIKHIMQTAMTLNVPVEVEYGTGDNWLQAH
jgi:DNA polymerase I-like protein with 3'-5' exonuclease and polymerase domains